MKGNHPFSKPTPNAGTKFYRITTALSLLPPTKNIDRVPSISLSNTITSIDTLMMVPLRSQESTQKTKSQIYSPKHYPFHYLQNYKKS